MAIFSKLISPILRAQVRRATTQAFRQDLPPSGGYANIVHERIKLSKGFGGFSTFAFMFALSAGCFCIYYQNRQYVILCKREDDDINVSLEPLLTAERDRIYLNQLRKNRDDERELMKNVPGWVVGTYYGEPLYKTIGDDKLMHPTADEYFAHTRNMWKYYSTMFEVIY